MSARRLLPPSSRRRKWGARAPSPVSFGRRNPRGASRGFRRAGRIQYGHDAPSGGTLPGSPARRHTKTPSPPPPGRYSTARTCHPYRHNTRCFVGQIDLIRRQCAFPRGLEWVASRLPAGPSFPSLCAPPAWPRARPSPAHTVPRRGPRPRRAPRHASPTLYTRRPPER
jgi:hypothetical protein